MTETAKAQGLPAEFEWRGRTYLIGPLSLKVEGLFCRAVERRTAEGIDRNRAALGEQAYLDALRLFNDDVGAGEFEWTGRAAEKAKRTHAGTKEMIWLRVTQLKGFDPAKTPLARGDMDGLFKDVPKWNEAVRLMDEMDAVPPNGQRPSAAAAAGQSGGPQT